MTTTTTKKPIKPRLPAKTFVLNCSTMDSYRDKPIEDMIASVRRKLVRQGGDPKAKALFGRSNGNWGDWVLSLVEKMTDEQKEQLAVWEAYDSERKRESAIKRIKKLAEDHGLAVTVEGDEE